MPHDIHHYVPAFLLRQWQSPPDWKLSAFRWINDKLVHERYKAKNVAKRARLYSLRSEIGSTDNVLERDFFGRDIDDPAAAVHRRIVEDGIDRISSDDRVTWARFVVAQMLRVPRMIAYLKQRATLVLRTELDAKPEEYDAIKGDSQHELLSDWVANNAKALTSDNFALSALPELVESDLLHDVMRRATWGTFDLSKAPQDLLISDHPVQYVGTMDTSFLIVLPIAPRKAFLAFNQVATGRRLRALSLQELVQRMNYETLRIAEHYAFASDSTQLQFVQQHLPRPREPAR